MIGISIEITCPCVQVTKQRDLYAEKMRRAMQTAQLASETPDATEPARADDGEDSDEENGAADVDAAAARLRQRCVNHS